MQVYATWRVSAMYHLCFLEVSHDFADFILCPDVLLEQLDMKQKALLVVKYIAVAIAWFSHRNKSRTCLKTDYPSGV